MLRGRGGPGPVPGGQATLVGLERVQLACALTLLGDADWAVTVCEDALRVCETYGEEWVRSYALRVLALAHTVREDWRRAEPPAREALRTGFALHDVLGIAPALDLLARVATAHHAHERAAVLLGGADRVGRPPLPWSPYGGTARPGHARAWDAGPTNGRTDAGTPSASPGSSSTPWEKETRATDPPNRPPPQTR